MLLPSSQTLAGRLALSLVCLVVATTARTQPAPAADPFGPVAGLLGRWKGTVEGQSGTGTVAREYSRVLGGRFIRVHNRTDYPPQPGNAKGEVHEDDGFISYDRGRRALVFRQFHVEGFVNQYVANASAGPVVFTSEAIENIPPGWRARETYIVQSPDAFEEVFELAEPGKAFEVYSRSRLKRVR